MPVAYDRRVRVSYLGPPGTFSEEALLTQPDLASGEMVPLSSVPEVVASVERGDADCGIVPIENMIEGSVTVTLDTLAWDTDLLIQREVDLPISLLLCAKPGTQLGDVKTVLAHPLAAAQCREWLAKKLPGAEIRASNSNAEAPREVKRSRRGDVAAIGTTRAAELYELSVLATEIEDHPENETRFVVVGRGVPKPTGHDKTTIVCFQRVDKPGSLLAILQEFAARSINLVKLESRPTKRDLGDYCFFIDAEGHIADELLADALRNLSAKQAEVKFLGSYPVGDPSDHAVARRTAAGKAWREATAWVDELRGRIRASDALADPDDGA